MKFFNVIFLIISVFSALILFKIIPIRGIKNIEGLLFIIAIIGMFYFGLLFALALGRSKSNNYKDPGVGNSDGGGY